MANNNISISVKDHKFKIKVGNENTAIKKHKNEAMVMGN
jgi:hypothetical protein